MKKSVIRQVMRELGRRGGLARAAKNSRARLSELGAMGGRPKGKKDTKPRKRRSRKGSK